MFPNAANGSKLNPKSKSYDENSSGIFSARYFLFDFLRCISEGGLNQASPAAAKKEEMGGFPDFAAAAFEMERFAA